MISSARLGDKHACPLPGHGTTPIASASADTNINFMGAARVGDVCGCGAVITTGFPSILVNGRPMAHLGSPTSHGGTITTGSADVGGGFAYGGSAGDAIINFAALGAVRPDGTVDDAKLAALLADPKLAEKAASANALVDPNAAKATEEENESASSDSKDTEAAADLEGDGRFTRKKLGNGLWAPVIAVGAERDVPGATPANAGKRIDMVPFVGQLTSISKALTAPEYGRSHVNTDLLNPMKKSYSEGVISALTNTNGGASFIFSMLRMTYSGASKGEFNALQIVDVAAGEVPDQANAVAGYWVPQGGYVDIPITPVGINPEYVFTPGFSGCSLTVDQLSDTVLRVRHVEGGKEQVQYNTLPATEHGLGLCAAMEYLDYGFDTGINNNVETQLTGFAFMKLERNKKVWNIHYQSVQGASGIVKYDTAKHGFFSRSKSSVNVFEHAQVRKTMTRQVLTVD